MINIPPKNSSKNDFILSKHTNLSKLAMPITSLVYSDVDLKEIYMEAITEQRKEIRSVIAWPVSVWMPDANRFFNGRSANISKSGVFIKVPMTMPIRPGNMVEVNFPRTAALAKDKGQFARIKCGKVVRVDRESMLKGAEIGVGIAFV